MPNLRLAIATVLLLADHAHGQEPITLTGHGGWIGAVAFSPDSRRLAGWLWGQRRHVAG